MESRPFLRSPQEHAALVFKACGGDDKYCGSDLTNEDSPVSLGWPGQCPDLLRAGCGNAVNNDCSGIVACLTCTNASAVDRPLNLAYGDLELPSDGALNKCQKAIGKATSRFLSSKSKALQKCWDARLNGKHGNSCVPPAVGDGKYLAAIQKAETKKVDTVCKACGGGDKKCDADVNTGLIVSGGATVVGTGGSDDLTPAAIGFATSCPDVTLPYAPNTSCNTLDDIDGALDVIDSLRELILCTDCVAEAATDCADASQMTGVTDYPAECNACVAGPPTSGACPTKLQFTVDGPSVDLDSGWTGLAQDFFYPSDLRTTLAVSCAGPSRPNCGVCNLTGPIPNDGGPTFDTRRCTIRTWIHCDEDGDCLGTCAGGTNASEPCNDLSDCPDQSLGTSCTNGGTCEYFLSPPLSLVAGGVSACIVNQLDQTVSGTINVETGDAMMPMSILSRVYPTGTVVQPCPVCRNGQCEGGDRAGSPCVVNGSSRFGDVSLDCPPAQGAQAGSQKEALQNMTGPQTWTLDSNSIRCRGAQYKICMAGANALAVCVSDSECPASTCEFPKCFCDTCNNANADPCATNADCVAVGATVCGGKRCMGGGASNGTPCAVDSECTPGFCNQPGMAPLPNPCNPPDGAPDGCQLADGNEGVCVDGPVDKYCSLQPSIPCDVDTDCDPAPAHPDYFAGQTCVPKLRECFPDNGVIGGSVSVSGQADPPCRDTYSDAHFSSLFCLAPSGASGFNTAAGEPGLVRQILPGKLILTP